MAEHQMAEHHACIPLESDGRQECDLFACPICGHCLSHCVGHSQLLDGLKLLLRPVHRHTAEPQAIAAQSKFQARKVQHSHAKAA